MLLENFRNRKEFQVIILYHLVIIKKCEGIFWYYGINTVACTGMFIWALTARIRDEGASASNANSLCGRLNVNLLRKVECNLDRVTTLYVTNARSRMEDKNCFCR